MVNAYAKIMGLILLVVGFAGTLPFFMVNGLLFGLFMVDPIHNSLHILSGLILLTVGFSANFQVTRNTTLFVAAVYGVLTVLGFILPYGMVLGMPMNMLDNVLHLTITATAIMFGLPARNYPMTR